MNHFKDSHLGKLRQIVGQQLLLVPGVRIIIENADGKILLQKRRDLKVWGLPGGNSEPSEDLLTVVEREVFEETGLTVTNAKPFGFGSNPKLETIKFPNGDQCQFFVLNFFTKSFSGELRTLDGESIALNWYSKDALPEMLPNMKESVRAYERFSNEGEFQMF